MIQALMLVSLGFFAAALLALLVAPAAWARAVRLTSHRIRASLPINETEIRAEKDQLRATHAVVVHQLEKKIERAEMSAARQRVELNRRDARINDLEAQATKITGELDENRNARHVLAQTLNERLPRAEERLRETRDLLKARDAQVAKFVASATKQHAQIAQASALIRQQEEENKRLQAALMARQSAGRHRVPTEALEQTVALQSEVRELRERTASQSRLIERIQEAERTQLQTSTEDDAVRTASANGSELPANGASNRAMLDESAEFTDEPQGFAARFNRWRVALQREKETTARLRTELANAHDRAAKLSASYRDQMRDLTSGRGSAELAYGMPTTSTHSLRQDEDASRSVFGGAPEARNKMTAPSKSGDQNGASAHNRASTEQRAEAAVAAKAEASSHREANELDATNGGGARRGTLTERIKATDQAAKSTPIDADAASKEARELQVVAARQSEKTGSVKSGTLLQRLKGMEEA